jgi:hypothetical protein
MDSASASIIMIGLPADYLIILLFSYAYRSIPFNSQKGKSAQQACTTSSTLDMEDIQ